jgi:hypothetical protein
MPHETFQDEFRREVARYLEPLTTDLVTVLRRLISYPYPPQVVRIEFDVFDDGFRCGFPVRAYFFDADYNEHFEYKEDKAQYPCDVDPALLDIPRVYPSHFEDRFTTADPDLDTWTAAGETLIDWFTRCWRDAGGEAFSREANIGIHDMNRRFDLVRRTWYEPHPSSQRSHTDG